MLIAFEKVVIFSGKYLNLKIIFPNFTAGQMLIYYLLVIIGIYCFKNIRLKKAATLVFLLFLTIIYFSPVLNITGEV